MDVLKEGLVTQCCAELLKFALHIECLDIITVIFQLNIFMYNMIFNCDNDTLY